MNSPMMMIWPWRILSILLLFGLLVCTCSGQEPDRFALKGTTEAGGSISFMSTSPVYNDQTGDASTNFMCAPFVGYFVTDGFEIGVNPLGITVYSLANGPHTTVLNLFVAPSYNFRTEGSAYPFIEALLGYTSVSDGVTQSGFSWGGRGGVKVAVTGHALANLAVEYLQITLNPSGATKRTGSNQLLISAGFTVWFKGL
jgi:hypothetical protein